MRVRAIPTPLDQDGVIDLNCDPDLDPPRLAEARQLLHGTFGPVAEPMLRACGQAAAARRELAAAREQLDRLLGGTQLRGIVTGVNNGRVRVLLGGTERILARPEDVTLGIGQTVATDADGRTVLAAGDFLLGGQTFAFAERLEDRHALVRPLREGPDADARQLAVVAESVDLDALVPEDRVLGWTIDGGNVVLVTRRLGPLRPAVADDGAGERRVTREDIVGLEEQIERVDRLFLTPPSAAYEALIAEASRACVGAVFLGVAGCGKSLVADMVATAVRARGGLALSRTASFYLSKWVGEGAGRLRADFARLDAAFAETGVRPLLVIDELEAIALDRSQAWTLNRGHVDVLDTLLERLTHCQTRMIGISNVADRFLDAALVRDGRLPIVRFPAALEPEQVSALVARCLARVPLAAGGGAP
jgi:hypothetical protein